MKTETSPPRDLRPAIFLDRDGTLNREIDYLRCAEELELLRIGPALRALASAGYALVVVTNQSGVARGSPSCSRRRTSRSTASSSARTIPNTASPRTVPRASAASRSPACCCAPQND